MTFVCHCSNIVSVNRESITPTMRITNLLRYEQQSSLIYNRSNEALQAIWLRWVTVTTWQKKNMQSNVKRLKVRKARREMLSETHLTLTHWINYVNFDKSFATEMAKISRKYLSRFLWKWAISGPFPCANCSSLEYIINVDATENVIANTEEA